MCARKPRPLPPYSSGMVTPSSPISPNFFHLSAGGAISFSANPCTDSRSRSMSSPSGNGRISDSLLSRRTILAYAWRPCRQSPGQEKGPPMPWAALDAPTRRLLPAHAALEAGTAVAHVRQLDLADGADALLGQAVGGQVGRHVLGLADLEDAAQVVVDRAHHAHRALAVVAVDFQRHVHHAAGIHRVIRCIQHAALLQLVADLAGGQLVVGRAADDLRLDAVDRLRVDGAAQRARRVHVSVDVVDLVQAHRFATQLVDAALHRILVDVGDEYLGALFAQQLDELAADVAGALHGEAVLAHVLVAVLELQRGHQALQRAVGGERRRIARAAVHLV